MTMPSLEPPFDIVGVTAARVTTADVTLSVLEAGPRDGPLVVLLHGFPELSYGWRHQIPVLVDAGCFVVAPDQRGYGFSDAPEDLDAYVLDRLADDVRALLDHYGRADAIVVGHDWGAFVAWWLALHHPGRVRKLVIMNVPHPAVFSSTLRSSPRQLLRSWYVAFFQLPVLPEMWLRRRGAELLRDTSREGSFTDDDLDVYRAAFRRPGVAAGMLAWYRALRRRSLLPTTTTVKPPTLILWGRRDAALVPEMAPASLALCEDGTLVMIDDATHWVQHDARDRVNAALVGWCAAAVASEPHDP